LYKGTVPQHFFSLPQAPGHPIRAVSNFFENSQRYSQLKEIEKIFNQKSFKKWLVTAFTSSDSWFFHLTK